MFVICCYTYAQSVAGLVSTLLPTLVTANSAVKVDSFYRYLPHRNGLLENAQIPIHYFQDEKAEVMHGVGTHSSSHTVSGHSKGEAVYEGACALSNALAKEQSKVAIFCNIKVLHVIQCTLFFHLAEIFHKEDGYGWPDCNVWR